MTNVRAGHERYYLDQVALGTEAPGWWLGELSAELGLEGAVGEEAFRRLLEGRHPQEGTALRRPTAVRARDLTFSQPKSISVFWALAPPPVATALEEANTAALTAACSYIERQGVWLNDGSRGPGIAAAVFPHRTSRAADPHLHAHVVVANLSRSRTGHRAVATLPLAAVLSTAGHLYQAELRHEVGSRLGLEWGEVNHGVAQLQAVPESLRRVFSRRRAQVERTMAEHHGSSSRSARLAALVGRPERETDLAQADLRAQWELRARRAGFEPELLMESTSARTRPAATGMRGRGGTDPGSTAARARLGDLGFDDVSSFSRAEVLEALSGAARQGGTISGLEREADRLLASGEVGRFPGPVPLRRRDVARTPSGPVVVAKEPRWRSRSGADAEERLAASARRGLTAGRGRAPVPPAVGTDHEVGDAVRSLLDSGRGVELVESAPGWRREAVLAGACQAWRDAGGRVMLTGAGGSAAELGEVTGLTVHRTASVTDGLAHLRSGGPAVVLVVGAESVPAPVLADLAESADRLGSKLVLVGEPGHLPDVDRAGGWRAARAAIGSLRLGHSPPALERPAAMEPVLEAAPWLVLGSGLVALRQRLVADWLSSPAGAAMVASRRTYIDELNRRARAGLVEQGRLGPPTGLPGLTDARQGEAVVVGRAAVAARRIGLVPGTTLHLDDGELVSGSGARWRVSRVPVEADLRYAYARTPYQAWRANASPLLVLGPPPPGPRPERSVYYTVGPSRTRDADMTVGPSRTRDADMTVAQRAWVAAAYERPRSRERTRERSLGRG